jgi:hypothetical protein
MQRIAALKVEDFPFSAVIHRGTTRKEYISKEDFFEVIKKINYGWTALKEGLDLVEIEGTRWEHKCGVIFAKNQDTFRFIQAVVNDLDINGRIRAWAVGESDGFEDVRVIIAPFYSECDPADVVRQALAKSKIKGEVVLNRTTNLAGENGQRLAHFSVDTATATAIKANNCILRAGIGNLNFRFGDSSTTPPIIDLTSAPAPDSDSIAMDMDSTAPTVVGSVQGAASTA